MQNILTLETKKYAIRLENFEGPLDLLCHLIDKNKMDIYKVNISEITDQYIEYINKMEEYNLEIASEFLIMASTLLYLKSKGLLPKTSEEDETEITEEELIRRIIDYKKYKEISKILKERYNIYKNRFFKLPDNIKLPKQELEKKYNKDLIPQMYEALRERTEVRLNINNKETLAKIALSENITIASKVKIIFKELLKKPKIIFNQVFNIKDNTPLDVITAFLSVLELNKRNKVMVEQKELFGDIVIEKSKHENETV